MLKAQLNQVHPELRHRGRGLVEYPGEDLWEAVGGEEGVTELIRDLYRRMEGDALLRVVFPHFQSALATPFFVQWFGGGRGYSDGLEGGLLRRHRARYVGPKAAGAWLRYMLEALKARGVDADQVMGPLSRIAKAMVHNADVDPGSLCRSCGAVRDPVQERFEKVLEDAAKGRVEKVRSALAEDDDIAGRRGTNDRTLAWVATYHNRPKILDMVLKAGGDCNSPACEPMHATMACDVVRMGTGVSVTPLAVAKKWHPELVGMLVEQGSVDDVFSAAWLGELVAVREYVDRNPELLNAIDPADDFQEVSLLCHAVWGGNIDVVKLLLERGAEVKRHSGKLLTLAVVMNRVDLVKLLIEYGADARRSEYLGRLDDEERPVADMLVANGKKVPGWMLPHACRADVSSNELHRVKVLLDYGAGLNDRNRHGLTALHYAVRGGKVPVIKLLLERGADANVKDWEGFTPLLHLAKRRSKADPIPVMELLVEHGADVSARDQKGRTVGMHFVKQGKGGVVKWLRGHGAKLDKE